jgi:hypothetical protein
MKSVDLVTTYQTAPGKVRFDIVIGNAQIGASVVKLNKTEVARGDISDLDLGSGNTLAGKSLTIKSVVTDVNDSTNRTSIKYVFRRGQDLQEFLSKVEVENNGESIIYRALFKLV